MQDNENDATRDNTFTIDYAAALYLGNQFICNDLIRGTYNTMRESLAKDPRHYALARYGETVGCGSALDALDNTIEHECRLEVTVVAEDCPYCGKEYQRA